MMTRRMGLVAGWLVLMTLAGPKPTVADTPNVVVQWNLMLQTLYGTGPGIQLRALPMMHIAMFDAINSIEQRYTPYLVDIRRSHGASTAAAAAKAARDVLVALYPTQQATFDTLLASQLDGVSPGHLGQALDIGARTAKAVLDWRQHDGWPATIAADPAYVLPAFPGLWQPTPPTNGLATFTFYPKVMPFALLTATQFLVQAPPTLTSARYAADLDETKRLGSVSSTERTPEQTLMAQVHAGVNTTIGFFHVWNLVARDSAQREGLSLIDTARLFVLVNVALHDGLQTSFTGKFVYGFWRPVTAIRRAAEDLNPETEADPAWTPLLATPPYPSHGGNVACLSAAAARALQLVHGRDDIPFTITYPRTGGLASVVRDYHGFWDLADQQARSRIYGGIHFQFESEASQAACVKVPEFAWARFMRPKH